MNLSLYLGFSASVGHQVVLLMLVLESNFEEEGLSTNFRTCGLGNWFKFFLSPLLLV